MEEKQKAIQQICRRAYSTPQDAEMKYLPKQLHEQVFQLHKSALLVTSPIRFQIVINII